MIVIGRVAFYALCYLLPSVVLCACIPCKHSLFKINESLFVLWLYVSCIVVYLCNKTKGNYDNYKNIHNGN